MTIATVIHISKFAILCSLNLSQYPYLNSKDPYDHCHCHPHLKVCHLMLLAVYVCIIAPFEYPVNL